MQKTEIWVTDYRTETEAENGAKKKEAMKRLLCPKSKGKTWEGLFW